MFSTNFINARKAIFNPKARGQEKAIEALAWISRWGHSSPLVIDQLSGVKRRGLTKRLIEAGLVKSIRSASGGFFHDVPNKIVTLTPKGFQVLDHFKQLRYGYDFNKAVNQVELRHHHSCQKVALYYYRKANLHHFLTEMDRQEKSLLAQKQPDLVVVFDESIPTELANGIQRFRRVGIEVELTGKYNMKFDQFVYSTLLSLNSCGGIDEVEIYFDSIHQLNRYKKAFTPGSLVNIWEKNDRGYWVIDEVDVVPEYIRNKIQFKLLS